jgi:hypothetical protein
MSEPFNWDDGPLIEAISNLVADGVPAEEIATRAREIAEHEQDFKDEA